ncbi:hypothetical protein [Nocardia fluminea]|uniref:hypothetical protein n=1 Tax=Nocardia fluminea TaxID=134984 RepID=UPI003649EFB4
MDTGPSSTQYWIDRAAEINYTDDLGHKGDEDYYDGRNPIEDVALAPHIAWNEADRAMALKKAAESRDLQPGQWIELDWPPTGHLWTPGYVYWTEFESCVTHSDAYNERGDETEFEDCDDCRQRERIVESPAEWTFSVRGSIYEVRFDSQGCERDREIDEDSFEVCMVEQDPANILIGPPGNGFRD